MGVSVSLKEVWNEWELRALVLLSLTLQIILIIMGNRRKYTKNNIWITIIVWFPYLIADAVATTALGVLTRSKFVDDGGVETIALGVLTRSTFVDDGHLDANMELQAFWAPFLLLHLGGPDTITAYSLEDNELWTRHLLQLVVQTGFAFYIFVMAWTGSLLSVLSIPMLFAGLLKYGERTWVLWSASYEQRRLSESIEGLPSSIGKNMSFGFDDEDDNSLLAVAYRLGKLTKWFFLDMVIEGHPNNGVQQLENLCEIWVNMSDINAFKTIEMELGFMYDKLYTKAMVTYTPWGIVLRLVSFLLSCTVLILFLVSYHKQKFSKADRYITFLLLTVAVFLELYAALVALSSNQSIAWLTTHDRRNISRAILSCRQLFRNPTWSNSMGQFSMLSYFLKEKPMGFRRLLLYCLPKSCHKIPNISQLEGNLERQEYESYQKVTENLKLLIYRCFLEDINTNTNVGEPIRSTRGKISLERNGYDCDTGILARIIKADVDVSVIVWHVVTELSYDLDADDIKEINKDSGGNAETVYDDIGLCYEISKYISKYMMHLLVFSPSLFPKGGVLSEARLRDAFITGRHLVDSVRAREGTRITIIQSIHDQLVTRFPRPTTEDSTRSELIDHVHELLDFFLRQSNEQNKVECKWKTILGVWVELLAHISSECTGNQHAQLLRQGGELLTHVSLLMAHLGLTRHFPFLLPLVYWNRCS